MTHLSSSKKQNVYKIITLLYRHRQAFLKSWLVESSAFENVPKKHFQTKRQILVWSCCSNPTEDNSELSWRSVVRSNPLYLYDNALCFYQFALQWANDSSHLLHCAIEEQFIIVNQFTVTLYKDSEF